MGTLKALLPWGNTTLLGHTIRELQAAAIPLVVVLGHAAEELRPVVEAAAATAVLNPRYREGRATSIAAGTAALPPGTQHVLIASVDQPRPRTVHQALIRAHLAGDAPITRACYRGRHGHPTIFASTLFDALRRLDETTEGLKAVVRSNPIQDVEIDDPAVLLNLNTPADYHQHRPC